MPRRSKASAQDTRAAVTRSFREYGGNLTGVEPHLTFYRKITTQTVNQTLAKHDKIVVQVTEIPYEREKAIEMVFTLDLYAYLDKKMFDLKSECAHDALEKVLRHEDDWANVVGWSPFYFRNDSITRFTKRAFEYFDRSSLDPFKRFTLHRESLLPHELAWRDCSNDEGWLNGYAFEALTASHAVWSQKCWRCGSASLRYCGGAETAWRDVFCTHCQSCYEIKSKKDKATIDKIARFDGLNAGSFRVWCEEDFSSRTMGTDYIVLVNRTPCRDGTGWAVYVAQIGSVLPVVSDMSFACAHDQLVPIRTRVTMKTKPQLWFKVPGGDLGLDDFQKLFRRSYQQVFPGKPCQNLRRYTQRAPSASLPVKSKPTSDIEAIKAMFSELTTADNWDDED